jgi:hypothetical protein
MDRDEALKLLTTGKAGIEEWNRRRRSGEAIPDLHEANLRRAELGGADLSQAELGGADLRRAGLSGADLCKTRLNEADLRGADLTATNLREAKLNAADLNSANLTAADLNSANLTAVNLSWSDLRGADFSNCICWYTLFADVDLSEVKGLESITHRGPSTLGIDTLLQSNGKIPEEFLRGCGLTPWEVLAASLYRPEVTPAGLVDLQHRIFDAWTKSRSMINGCFISYSRKDARFVDKLRDRLVAEGINVWLDRHDIVAGNIQDQVWQAIQVHHVVILVLTKDSVKSDWVEGELEIARSKEQPVGRAVLCPIALDDAWKTKVEAREGPGDPNWQLWRTLKQKVILDFSQWKTKAFEAQFQKLLRGLNQNYGPR